MESPIIFNYEEIDFVLENEDKTSDWIQKTIINEGKEFGEISYIFTNDEYILDINKKYLNHDFYTDVITFDYSDEDVVSGDIFISIDMIKYNSKKYKTEFSNELFRVIIHGILHLLGYEDKETDSKILMTQKEDYYLSLL
jgi:rRNA maturation RNase YbeY